MSGSQLVFREVESPPQAQLASWLGGVVQQLLDLVQSKLVQTLQWYSGERGRQTWLTKWGFYLYYPAHLFIIGALRLMIWGDIPIVL